MKKLFTTVAFLFVVAVSFTACSSSSDENTSLASLTTNAALDVTSTTAVSGGNITSDGASAITARGTCWSTSANPTIADSKTTETGTTGNFISAISGLAPNTNYFARAYATNASGTAYGNQVLFQTLTEVTVVTFIKFKYNNVQYDFIAETYDDVKKEFRGSQGINAQYKKMSLFMPLTPTLGNHAVTYDNFNPNSYEGHFVSQAEGLYLDGTTGNINITAISSTQIEGTFSFSGTNSNTGGTVNITEGTFRANRN